MSIYISTSIPSMESKMIFLPFLLLLFLLLTPYTSQAKSVFAHVLVRLLPTYTQSQWAQEISDASASGIDAFSLSISKNDTYTYTQLQLAYAAAEATGGTDFKLFLSFDFSYYKLPADTDLIAHTIINHMSSPAQFKVNDKPLVTTFIGDNQDWSGVKSQVQIFLVANWADPNSIASTSHVDGGYPWNAWGTVNNRGVTDPNTKLVNQDSIWEQTLGSKPYFAPISPWFFTHYPPNSYNKNWIFPTEDLFLTRWQHMLEIKPYAVYQMTWNDYSESSYLAPLRADQNLYPGGASAWTDNMPHDGFRLIQNAFAKAYKVGATSPLIEKDNIVYWYRIHSKNVQCNDTTGRPDAYNLVSDTLFITTLLTLPAHLIVNSGGKFSIFIVDAGVVMSKVPIHAGHQSFTLGRNNHRILSGTSEQSFTTDCPSNVYNFNTYVGVL